MPRVSAASATVNRSGLELLLVMKGPSWRGIAGVRRRRRLGRSWRPSYRSDPDDPSYIGRTGDSRLMSRPRYGTTPRYETASSNVLLGVARYGGGGLDGARGEGVRTLLRRGQAPPGRSGVCVHREPSRRPGRGPGSATAGLEGLGSREPARRPARLGSSCPAQPSRELLASRSNQTPAGTLISELPNLLPQMSAISMWLPRCESSPSINSAPSCFERSLA